MSITGSDGMLSFNPGSNLNNLSKPPVNPIAVGLNGEAPPMSFGGTTL